MNTIEHGAGAYPLGGTFDMRYKLPSHPEAKTRWGVIMKCVISYHLRMGKLTLNDWTDRIWLAINVLRGRI